MAPFPAGGRGAPRRAGQPDGEEGDHPEAEHRLAAVCEKAGDDVPRVLRGRPDRVGRNELLDDVATAEAADDEHEQSHSDQTDPDRPQHRSPPPTRKPESDSPQREHHERQEHRHFVRSCVRSWAVSSWSASMILMRPASSGNCSAALPMIATCSPSWITSGRRSRTRNPPSVLTAVVSSSRIATSCSCAVTTERIQRS